ncbi:unnamed protein product, partial [Cuscuta europaea]
MKMDLVSKACTLDGNGMGVNDGIESDDFVERAPKKVINRRAKSGTKGVKNKVAAKRAKGNIKKTCSIDEN